MTYIVSGLALNSTDSPQRHKVFWCDAVFRYQQLHRFSVFHIACVKFVIDIFPTFPRKKCVAVSATADVGDSNVVHVITSLPLGTFSCDFNTEFSNARYCRKM